MYRLPIPRAVPFLLLCMLSACGGGGDGPPTSPPSVKPPTVATVSVTPATVTLEPRQTKQLTAALSDSTGAALSGRTVSWASSNAAVADINAGGLVTAVAPGKATITATSEGKSASAEITVNPATLASITIAPATITLEPKQTSLLTAKSVDATGYVLSDRKPTWSSSNKAAATVSDSGRVTAVAPGKTTITATAEGKSATAEVTVSQASVATVRIAPAAMSLEPQESGQLTATLEDAFGGSLTGRAVSWTTSAAAIATVSNTGLVTATAIGKAFVTATSEGKKDSVQVTVAVAPVASVTVTAPMTVLVVGQKLQLNAAPRSESGKLLTGRSIEWTSSAPAVASVVSTSGMLTAVSEGSVTITARSEGKSGTAALVVAAGSLVGSAGGTVMSSDRSVTVVIPPGAVSAETPVSITKLTGSVGSAATGTELNGAAYRVGPGGLTFAKPVTVKLRYDTQTLPRWAMGGDITLLRLNGSQWTPIGNATVDVGAGTVGTTITGTGSAQALVRPGMLRAGLFASDEDESGLTLQPGVNYATVTMNPTSGSVNTQKRFVMFSAALKPIGDPITLPAPPGGQQPLWKFRWRTTGKNGTLGSADKSTGWTTNSSEQYIATSPNLNTQKGELDKVYVDVLLNPSEENNPSAWKIVTREATVDADLKTTYEITPEDETIGPGEELTLRFVMRDEHGRIIEPAGNLRSTWTTSGNHGSIRSGGDRLTAIYTALDPPTFQPPWVDDIRAKVEGLSFIEQREVKWHLFSSPPSMEIVREYTEERKLEGEAKAFVTVKIDYKAHLTPESVEIGKGDSKTFTVSLEPEYNGQGLEYKYSVVGNRGTLDVGPGRTTSASVTYTAKSDASPGIDKLRVDVVSVMAGTELETLATGEASIEISSQLQGSCTGQAFYTGTAWVRTKTLVIPKVQGATSYEVNAVLHDGSLYSKTFSGATTSSSWAYNEVFDRGNSFSIAIESGVGQNQAAQENIAAQYQQQCNSTSVLYKTR